MVVMPYYVWGYFQVSLSIRNSALKNPISVLDVSNTIDTRVTQN